MARKLNQGGKYSGKVIGYMPLDNGVFPYYQEPVIGIGRAGPVVQTAFSRLPKIGDTVICKVTDTCTSHGVDGSQYFEGMLVEDNPFMQLDEVGFVFVSPLMRDGGVYIVPRMGSESRIVRINKDFESAQGTIRHKNDLGNIVISPIYFDSGVITPMYGTCSSEDKTQLNSLLALNKDILERLSDDFTQLRRDSLAGTAFTK
jgi:hypothetical protein